MHDRVWWRQLHWFEYGVELAGKAFLLFAGLSAAVFDFGAGSPLAAVLPDTSARLLITRLLFTGSCPLVAISPLERLSGGHINPAVTLAFWVGGKMHHLDLGGYIVGQFLDAASVRDGLTVPAASYPLRVVFLIEAVLICSPVLSIFFFLSNHRLMPVDATDWAGY